MYVPKHFRQTDQKRAHQLIREQPLGTLITVLDGRPEASHVPCLLDADEGPHGRLRFHLARENPSVDALGAGEALVVFVGAEAYISPDWYGQPNLVPTWNYIAVHAYGQASRLVDVELRALLDALSAEQEAKLPKRPWLSDKLPGDLYAKMRGAIVGFELPIRRLEAKWKLGQNRSRTARQGVVAELSALGQPPADAMAALMAELDDGSA